jgi:hypothetical protein
MISQASLRRFFKTFSKATVGLPKAEGNLYEAFVFLELCRQAQVSGFDVEMVSVNGDYRVRASPGYFGGDFGYAILSAPGRKRYEIHNGIQFIGNSRMEHEADIVLVGEKQPQGTGQPSALYVLIECKFYDSASRLKGEVRKAVGAVLDLSCSNHQSKGGHVQGCIHCGCRFTPFFVTNIVSGRRPDIQTFLKTYEVDPMFGVFEGGSGLPHFRGAFRLLLRALP